MIASLAILLITPLTTNAYETINQTAVQLNDDYALFTVSYRFGFLNRELYMPIRAMLDTDSANNAKAAEFQITLNGEAIVAPEMVSIVLGTSEHLEVREKEYYLPQGRAGVFTLLAIVRLPESVTTGDTMAMKMTHLPFTMVKDDDNAREAYLEPSELAEYQTPILTIEKGIEPFVTAPLVEAITWSLK
jgi:hypothetical protein